MLTQLQIRNFQAHGRIDLEFDPHITTIIGPNDIGKTAILRALQSVCLNESYPDSVRHGEDTSLVKLFIDGHRIRRKRGRENTYTLDGEVFRSFNTAVPDPIAKVLNVGELNFQNQHDSPFWFSETAGQLSRHLNRIVSLDLIDKVLAAIAQELRRWKFREEENQTLLDRYRTERDKLSWVKDLDSDLKRLEELSADIDSRRAQLSDLQCRIDEVSRLEERQVDATGRASEARKIARIAEAIVEKTKQVKRLRNILEQIESQSDRLHAVTTELHEIKHKLTLSGKVCPLCKQKVR